MALGLTQSLTEMGCKTLSSERARRFRVIFVLCFQDRRVSQARKQQNQTAFFVVTSSQPQTQSNGAILAFSQWRYYISFACTSLILSPWRWMMYIPPKCWPLSELYRVTTQKIAFFVLTAVRTVDPTDTNKGIVIRVASKWHHGSICI
jgi:hypothetical protein